MNQENTCLEYKREYIDDIRYTVLAFANTQGGRLLIGLEDDGTVCGVRDPDDTMLRMMNAIRDAIRPDVTLFTRCQTIEIEGKCVVELTVQRGTARPYYLAGKGIRPEGVYVRQGPSSVPASETAILQMIRETAGERYEEAVSIEQELTFRAADVYFRKKKLAFGNAQKRSLKLINDDGLFTNLGWLLSDQCSHSIKLAFFDGSTRTVFRDRTEAKGSLFAQLETCYNFIDRYNRIHSTFVGLERVDERDYPVEAIRESLLNCIVHRKYDIAGSTLISIFDDRMEFVSLGGLPTGIHPDDIGLGVSVLRNHNLAEVFYRLHLIEAYGTGIMKIHECYADAPDKPRIDISSNAFKITLPNLHFGHHSPSLQRTSSQPTSASNMEESILVLFQTHEILSRKDIEDALHVSQTSVINALRALVSRGLLVRLGMGKNTRYRKKET